MEKTKGKKRGRRKRKRGKKEGPQTEKGGRNRKTAGLNAPMIKIEKKLKKD